MKGVVYVPPMPQNNAEELKTRITAAFKTVTFDMLERTCKELGYRSDIVSATRGGHIRGATIK